MPMRSLDVETERKLTEYANSAGCAVGGAWSTDLLETRRGWMVTDMAEAHKSWHDWPDCPADVVPTRLDGLAGDVVPANQRHR
jgi:hypothetical protein